MNRVLLLLPAFFGFSLPAVAQVKSLKVDPPLKVGVHAVEQIHNLASTAVIAFDIMTQCEGGTGSGEDWDSRGSFAPPNPILPSQSVGVRLGDPKRCGKVRITGAVFADGHSEGDTHKIKERWEGSSDALKHIIPLVADMSNGRVTSAHFLKDIDEELDSERRQVSAEATGYCGVLVSVRYLWLNGMNLMRSGELVTLAKPDPNVPPMSKAPASDSSRASVVLRVLLDWQSRLEGHEQASDSEKSVLFPWSGSVSPPGSSKVPSITEGAQFKIGGDWIVPIHNLSPIAAEAIYLKIRCRTGTDRFDTRESTYDSISNYISDEVPIPPFNTAGMSITAANQCDPSVAGAIFADGHTEGEADAIVGLVERRQGAYKALGDLIPLIQALADGKGSNDDFRQEIKSRLNDGLKSRTPEADGYRRVVEDLGTVWVQRGGPIEFETTAGKTLKTVRIPPQEAGPPPAGLISLKDSARAAQVVGILEDWRSALEKHMTISSQ